MLRTRPAVAEIEMIGVSLVAGGGLAAVAGVAVLPPDKRGAALLAAALALGIVLAVGGPFVAHESKDVITEVRDDAGHHRLARPGGIALGNVAILAPFVLLAVLLDLELVAFGALLAGFGIWYFGLAHRLRRWERRTGRRLLLRPIYRWRGTNGRLIGRGWTDPANFVSGLSPPP